MATQLRISLYQCSMAAKLKNEVLCIQGSSLSFGTFKLYPHIGDAILIYFQPTKLSKN